MLRRFLILLALVSVFALVPHSASAQSLLCGPEYGGQECIDNFNNDAYGYGGSGGAVTSATCKDSFGCPQCQADMSKTMAVCVHVQFAIGFCTCSNPQKMLNEYDMPRCNLSGSCRSR